MNGKLRELGVHVDEAYVNEVENRLRGGIANENDLLDALVGEILFADMRKIGSGCLPNIMRENDATGVSFVLEGQFVLQIDEMVNVCAERDLRIFPCEAGPKRVLKFNMTDGKQRVVGIERSSLEELTAANSLPGMKVLLTNPTVVNGALVLDNKSFSILGGRVDTLVDIRDAMIDAYRAQVEHGNIILEDSEPV